ncbi:MAG: RNA methyltransferase [Bacteroidetes bacterium]|nr:RNA methyltransferase [Bacteroidota bacterium]
MNDARERRCREVLRKRQPDLTVVLEDITDPHNISAVLRSCDAVGVAAIHLIGTYEPYGKHLGSHSSASAFQWVNVHRYPDRESCVTAVRQQATRLLAACPEPGGTSLYGLDLTQPVALVFGSEQHGLSNDLRERCDGVFCLPQMGMLPSLNISVACAVSLYEALRQRQLAGFYENPRLDEQAQEALYRQWQGREIYRNSKH